MPADAEVLEDKPGKCPICSMDLVPVMKIGFALWQTGAGPWLRATGWIILGLAATIVATFIERWWDRPIRARVKAWRARSG